MRVSFLEKGVQPVARYSHKKFKCVHYTVCTYTMGFLNQVRFAKNKNEPSFIIDVETLRSFQPSGSPVNSPER